MDVGPVDAETQSHDADTTRRCARSIIGATRSSTDRSAASNSAIAVSVGATNRRDTATAGRRRVKSRRTPPDRRTVPGRIPAGRELGEQPLQRHLARNSRRAEQLIGRHLPSPEPSAVRTRGRLTGTRRPPRSPSRAHGRASPRAGRIVAALRAGQRSRRLASMSRMTWKPAPTANASRPSTQARRSRPSPRSSAGAATRAPRVTVLHQVLFFSGGPLPVGALGGTPDTYQTAGLERGTATSTSTRSSPRSHSPKPTSANSSTTTLSK